MPPKTGKPKRLPRTVSLPEDLVTALETRAREQGENFSRLVEQGARKAFDIPAPELPDVGNAQGIEDRGAREEVLAAMAELGPLWATRGMIMRETGIGTPYVQRTLLRLRRDGKVHEWGPAPYSVSCPRDHQHPDELPAHAEFPYGADEKSVYTAWALKPAESVWRPVLVKAAEKITAGLDLGEPPDLTALGGVLVRVALACTSEEITRMRATWAGLTASLSADCAPFVNEISRALINVSELNVLRRKRAREVEAEAARVAREARMTPKNPTTSHYPPPSAGPEFDGES